MHWLPWWAYPAACCFLAGAGCGAVIFYPAGYFHRELLELGRKRARLLAWQRKYRGRGPLRRLARWLAPAGLLGDIGRLWRTGRWT